MLLRGNLRLHQQGMDPAEIIVPLVNEEIFSLWKDNEYWQGVCHEILGNISNNSERIALIKIPIGSFCALLGKHQSLEILYSILMQIKQKKQDMYQKIYVKCYKALITLCKRENYVPISWY